MNIAGQIDQLMQNKNINLHQLSSEADIPYTTLNGIKKSGGSNIKLGTLLKLADFFNVSLDYLVGREHSNLTLEEYNELRTYKKYLEWRSIYGKN